MATLDDVRATLESARHGYLSTASPDGNPHLQPVVFQVVRDSVYIAIDEKPKTTLRLRRLTNIESNPKFALLIDHYDDDWNQLWWILLRGPADVLWPSEWDAIHRSGHCDRRVAGQVRAVRVDGSGGATAAQAHARPSHALVGIGQRLSLSPRHSQTWLQSLPVSWL